MTPVARRGILLAAGAAALAAGAGWRLWRSRGEEAPGPSGDDTVDDFWSLELPSPTGATLALRAFHGRPLVVNFWASWCPPCVKEMPDLDRFAREFSGRGWQVLGIAIDQPDPVQRFLQQTPVSFPIVLAGNEGLSWVRRLGNPAGGLPFSVQMGSDGRIVRRKLGATTFDELSGWTQSA
ncbi:TlpA disulfide reductase family protein [Ideonella sp. YS5]|uniref:TlpA disulfide reductase family protein n=1 Tax=Ideonella sp. YS5 TaxID=3453714 RepID=UPI003EE8F966